MCGVCFLSGETLNILVIFSPLDEAFVLIKSKSHEIN